MPVLPPAGNPAGNTGNEVSSATRKRIVQEELDDSVISSESAVKEAEALAQGLDYEHKTNQTFNQIKRVMAWVGAILFVLFAVFLLGMTGWLCWLYFVDVSSDLQRVGELLYNILVGVLLVLATLFVEMVFRKR